MTLSKSEQITESTGVKHIYTNSNHKSEMRTYKTDIIFSALDELSALKYCQETAQKTAVIELTKAVLSEYPTETENSQETEALKYVTKATDILDTPKMNEIFLCWCLENALTELLETT